jgi:erythromycin esterase
VVPAPSGQLREDLLAGGVTAVTLARARFGRTETRADRWLSPPPEVMAIGKRRVAGIALLLVAGAAAASAGGLRCMLERRAAWVRAQGRPVLSVQPEHGELSDLEPLAEALRGARVVMLGEESHGDGTAFLAKGRIMKLLIERLGFDVLIWEAGVFDCWQMDLALQAGKPPAEALALGLYVFWADSVEVQRAFDAVVQARRRGRPVEIAGLDQKLSAFRPVTGFADALAAFVDRSEPGWMTADRRLRLHMAVDRLRAWDKRYFAKEGARVRALLGELATLLGQKREPGSTPESRDADFYHRVVTNLASWMTTVERVRNDLSFDLDELNRIERVMAENLEWQLRRYAGRKVMVWAANGHVARTGRAGHRPMGEHIANQLGESVYSLALWRFHGQWGMPRMPATRIETAMGLPEASLHRVGAPYLFLDLRDAGPHVPSWLTESSRRFDGVFFIDHMEPATTTSAASRH